MCGWNEEKFEDGSTPLGDEERWVDGTIKFERYKKRGVDGGVDEAPLLFELCTSAVLRVHVYETGRH